MDFFCGNLSKGPELSLLPQEAQVCQWWSEIVIWARLEWINSSKWRFSYRTNCLELTVERRMVSKSGTIMDKTSISFPGKIKPFFLKSKITTVRHLSTVNLYLRQYQYNYPCAFRVQYINTTYKFMHNNYTIISYVRNKRQWDMHKKTINNRVTFTTRRRLFLYNSRYWSLFFLLYHSNFPTVT